jgi:pentatricopeptide repeat protein
MYNCKWCIRRCLNTFIGDINLAGQTCIYPSRIPSATRKAYNTGATPNQTEDRPSKFSVSRLSDNNSQSQLSKNRSASQETLSRDEARQRWLDSRGQRPTDKVGRFVPSKTRAIQKELVYVKDPLKLAEVVRDYLRKDLFLQAEELVKAASKDVLCTVSWNHMVDYLMSNGKINSAIKIYNEVRNWS